MVQKLDRRPKRRNSIVRLTASEAVASVAYTLQPRQVFQAALAGWINRHQQAAIEFLREENRVPLEQLGERRIRLTDDQRRRLAVAGKAVGRKALRDLAGLVTPDTILAWHRKLVAAKWDQRSRRGPGRPGVMKEIERLVVRFAGENPRWGYRRIEGAVANLLRRNGIDPTPERGARGLGDGHASATGRGKVGRGRAISR